MPAWMSGGPGGRPNGDTNGGGPPPPRDRDHRPPRGGDRGGGGPPHRDNYHRRGPPPYRGGGDYNNRRRPRTERRYRPNPHNRDTIIFHSYEEEREWVHNRRRARLARASKWDIPPSAEQTVMEELQKATLASTGPNPNVFLKPPPKSAMTALGGDNVLLSAQQTRHARRLYIGHLPEELSETQIHDFFKESIQKSIVEPMTDDPILSVYINQERRFAFVEFTSVDICTACLLLDGIDVCGQGKVKVKRPNDYNPSLAPAPMVDPNTILDLSKLGIISPTVVDSPNKIFIGGLPYHLSDGEVMELLGAFGTIKAFHLVKADATATTSKGYCFVEYAEEAIRDVAVMGLNGMDMGNSKVLTARIASAQDNAEKDPTSSAARVASISSTVGMVPVIGNSTAPGVMKIVDGVDVEALIDVAMGLAPLSAAAASLVPAVSYGGSMGVTPINGNGGAGVLDIANKALEAVFGGSNGNADGNGTKTKVLVLHNMVSDEDLASDEDYNGLKEEVREECEKFGSLKSMKIPRPQVSPMLVTIIHNLLSKPCISCINDLVVCHRMVLQHRQSGRFSSSMQLSMMRSMLSVNLLDVNLDRLW